MRRTVDLSMDRQGQLYEEQAALDSRLRWSHTQSDVVIRGISERTALSNIRNAILALQQEFSSDGGPRITLETNKLDDFQRRFLLIEREVEGLMKRQINYNAIGDQQSGERYLDYSGLLNEKENQIVELEKKINNLQERLRRATARQLQLENQIVHLNQRLLTKEGIINAKNQVILAEVAATNAMKETISKLKRNLDINKSKIGADVSNLILNGIVIPEIGSFDIKADLLTKEGAQGRSQVHSQSTEGERIKTKVIQMFREFERLFQQQNKEINKDQIERVIEGFLIELKGTRLYENVQVAIRRQHAEEQLKRLKDNFAVAAGIYQNSIEKMKIDNPNIKINLEQNLFEILQRQKIQAYKVSGGAVFVSDFSQRTVQVPVQDARTKHLLHLFASELKRLFTKYPKLHQELDGRIVQFFQQQIIDCIEVDQVDRLVQIVKYQPQIVKVENVYAYSNEKSRKVEFHLRVLIKALLEQLQKLKNKTGAVLEMDEGVVAMIKQEIMGVVEVDDILKVFRVVPKIVEVEKIVEKIVERRIQVPTTVTIDRIVEKIVEVQKIKEVDRVVNVPLEQPMVYDRCIDKIVPLHNTIQKVVEVPTIIEKIVQVIRQIPKIVQVERIQERVVEVEKIVEVERVVNHIEKEYHEVEVIVEKHVPVQKIVQVIRQVPVIVEKIIEKVVEIPKIIEVQKIVEKVVKVVEYKNAREIQNHIQIQHQIVERIVQKPIPIIQTIEKIVQVPQIVQKIVEIVNVQTRIQEVEVIVQKIVIQQRIKEIEKIVTQTIQVIKQVPREIDRFIEIPVIHQKIKIVQEFIEKPCIERIQSTTIQQVYLRDPLIVREPKIVQVEKIVNHYIEVPKPVKYIEEKIVQVIKIVDRIKQVRVEVDKIIEKMVEVPKVVEVEKIVEKIVVVPRVVQKVVQVPQIVEKAVEKQVIREIIREIERRVEVPVFQQRIVEVEVQKNIFVEVQKVIDRFVDKLVEVPRLEQLVEIKQVIQEKIIQVIKEVPKTMEVDKIVTLYADNVKLIEIERPIIVPAEIPVPVDVIREKLVIKEDIKERIVQVPQVIEKIVTVKEQEVIVQEIEKIIERIVVDTKIKEVEKIVPYIEQVIKQIPTIVERIVPVVSKVEEIVTAQQIIEKIVERTITIPKIYEVQSIREKVVQVPQFCEIEKIVPQLVRVNNYIQNVVEKIVQVPIIYEQLREVERQVQKIVKIENQVERLVEVQKNIEKIVIMEKLHEVVRNVNYVQQVLHIVQRLQQIPVETIIKEEVICQIPYILEKIVERIVVMPQIVEVLKYVHEVTQSEQLGVAVGVEGSVYEQKYKGLSREIKTHLDILLKELRGIKQGNPKMKETIEIIQKFLGEFDRYVTMPRIIEGIQERIVNKQVQVQKIVKIPADNERSLRMQLTLSLLVEKLIVQLKRIKQTANINLELDEDIKLIFFGDLNTRSKLEGDLSKQFESYAGKMMRTFESLGGWSLDHQLMLNSFLQERFMMAETIHEANMKIAEAHETSQKRLDALRRYKKDKNQFSGFLAQIKQHLGGLSVQIQGELGGVFEIINRFETYDPSSRTEPLRLLGQIVMDERISSSFREKEEQIYRLRDLVARFGAKSKDGGDHEQLRRLRIQNAELRSQLNVLQSRDHEKSVELLLGPIQAQLKELQVINLELESENSTLISEIINLQTQNKVLRELTGDASRKLSPHEEYISGSPIRSQFNRGGTHLVSAARTLLTEGGSQSGTILQGATVTSSMRGGNSQMIGSPERKEGQGTPGSTAYRGRADLSAVGGGKDLNMGTPARQADYRQWSSGQHGNVSQDSTPIRQTDSRQYGTTEQLRQSGAQQSSASGQQGQGHLTQSRYSGQLSGSQASNQGQSRLLGSRGQATQYGNIQQQGAQRIQGSQQLGQSYQSQGSQLQSQPGQQGQQSYQSQYTTYGQGGLGGSRGGARKDQSKKD